MGPAQAVSARVVLGGHPVLVARHVQRVHRDPEVPDAVGVHDHGVLHRVVRTPGNFGGMTPSRENRIMGRIDRASRLIAARPETVYEALLDRGSLEVWL